MYESVPCVYVYVKVHKVRFLSPRSCGVFVTLLEDPRVLQNTTVARNAKAVGGPLAHPLAHRDSVMQQVYEVLLCTPECQYDIALLYCTTDANSILGRVCASLAMVRPFAKLKPNIPVL